jgi:hypothetical protein
MLAGDLLGKQALPLMRVLLGRNVLGEQSLRGNVQGLQLSLMGLQLGRNVLGEQSLGIKPRWRDWARRTSRSSAKWRE